MPKETKDRYLVREYPQGLTKIEDAVQVAFASSKVDEASAWCDEFNRQNGHVVNEWEVELRGDKNYFMFDIETSENTTGELLRSPLTFVLLMVVSVLGINALSSMALPIQLIFMVMILYVSCELLRYRNIKSILGLWFVVTNGLWNVSPDDPETWFVRATYEQGPNCWKCVLYDGNGRKYLTWMGRKHYDDMIWDLQSYLKYRVPTVKLVESERGGLV